MGKQVKYCVFPFWGERRTVPHISFLGGKEDSTASLSLSLSLFLFYFLEAGGD